MNNVTSPIAQGDALVIAGDIHTIESIKGRWVKLSNGANVSRDAAAAGRAEYLEDAATLGAELADPEPVESAFAEECASSKAKYTGPMLALRERAKRGVYAKAANGQPSCGDDVAVILGALKPACVIQACIAALNLPGNPYTHLNIGQQSMNLRNKLRGALIRGEFGMGVVREAAEEAAIDQNVAYMLSPEFAAAQADIAAKQVEAAQA